MAKDVVEIPRKQYDAMVRVMQELAFRGPEQEALIMRAAKAGNITEVTTHIKRMRIYAKKHASGYRQQPEFKPRKLKRTRKPAGHASTGDNAGASV